MQNTDTPKNRVIIIGGDHHNGLGLARIFGLNGKMVTAIVISNKKRSWMATSKFIETNKVFQTEKEAFDYILDTYSEEPLKPVLIPYSDGAAMELDLRLNQFKNNFFVPSINGEQGKVAALMDKNAQYKWAVDHGIKMAKSVIVDLNNIDYSIIETVFFPVILKPVVSALGDKRDIVICQNELEFSTALQNFKEKKYKKIFCQEFLNIEYEIVVVGYVLKNKDICFAAHRVIRRWPDKCGTNSFSLQITDENVLKKCESLLKKIQLFGYQGLVDVELFWVNGKLYLNEVNWRNSGGDFRSIEDGFYFAYWFYLLQLEKIEGFKWSPSINVYSMVEYADVRHVIKRKISLFSWFRNLKKCSNFALFSKKDLKPFFSKFWNTLFR